tara:strand:- start:3464 stop:3634 length:171 start_codon:yes stop_codon:yes gene_type:complete
MWLRELLDLPALEQQIAAIQSRPTTALSSEPILPVVSDLPAEAQLSIHPDVHLGAQ